MKINLLTNLRVLPFFLSLSTLARLRSKLERNVFDGPFASIPRIRCRLRVGGLAQRHLRHRGKTRRNDLRVRFRAEFQRHRSAHKQHVYQGCSGESLTRDSRATWFWELPSHQHGNSKELLGHGHTLRHSVVGSKGPPS